MTSISLGASQPIQNTQPIEKKTTLEKGLDLAKEKTKKGTIVGDHYIAAGSLATVGGVAVVAGAVKLGDKLPAVDQALRALTSKGTGGAIGLAASVVLAEDATKQLKKGNTLRGGLEATGSAVTGLGGVELLAAQANVNFKPLTATGNFLSKNGAAIVGTGAAAGGAFAIKSGIDDLKEGKKVKGGAKIAGGTVGVLGGAELIGRQFNIPVVKSALTGPAKAVFTSKGGIAVAGAAIAATGALAGADGVRRMATGKGVANDLIGATEVTASVAAVTGGASLIGIATKSEKLTQVFPKSAEIVGGVALGTAAVALGKHTVNSVKEKGITLTNATTGTAAAISALGATQVVAGKFGVPIAEKALSKGWQPVLATGLGVAAYKLGKDAVSEAKEGAVVNSLGKGAGAVVLGGTSAAILGHALKIPGLENVGEKVIETTGKVVEPVFNFAVKNPGVTLAGVAVAGGVGAYLYYKKDGK